MSLHQNIAAPAYVLEETLLRRNLQLIASVAERSGVEIILAFKAYALWRTFPIFREYIQHSTASSAWEAQMAYEEMGSLAHSYSPAYTERDFADILHYSSHLSFNSLGQFERFHPLTVGSKVSLGLRINPQYSPVATDIYNPSSPGSRFGVRAHQLAEGLPAGIEGLHFHTLCESSSHELEKTLQIVERDFALALSQAKWLNMGGGHLMTRSDYDVEHLIALLQDFGRRHPHLKLILEPGSAFAWQTGFLNSTVLDIVCHEGIQTAILDVSFTCHMPDTLEMPYKPVVRGAQQEPIEGKPTYRLGGCSCLSGDYIGDWSFEHELKPGDTIILEDMLHYTTVKTNMFNGVRHPDIVLLRVDGKAEILRQYGYDDYKQRMD